MEGGGTALITTRAPVERRRAHVEAGGDERLERREVAAARRQVAGAHAALERVAERRAGCNQLAHDGRMAGGGGLLVACE